MRVISLLVIYYPFHELFLKFSGLSGPSLFLLRQWPDVAVVCLFFLVVFARASQRRIFLATNGFFPWLVVFLIWALILSIGTLGNNLGIAFSEIFVLLRFTFLFGTIALLMPSHDQIQRLIQLVALSVIIQSAVAFLQFFGGSAIVDFFKPADYASIVADVERSFTSNRENSSRVLIGTTGDFISLSYLLAIGIFMTFVSGLSKTKKSAVLILNFVLLFLCGSRTIFLGTTITVVIFVLMTQRLDKKFAYGIILLAALIPSTIFLRNVAQFQDYEYSNFLSLFDARILESLINQRLGVAVFVIPEYILSGDFVLGLSPDRFYVSDFVSQEYDSVPKLLLAVLPNVIEDIYPLALFLYYGLPGVILLGAIFLKLYRTSKIVYEHLDAQLGAIGIMTLIAVAIFSLGNQVLENRIFSFHFWLIMGLIFSTLRSKKDRHAHPPHP